ncbi:MAG: YihY/virulence factor BrkB family protein [Sphingobacteriales bacterium]|nr:MAG: YihY/virulence factor BrkB family protein [Sphingobacteriales bacterium]
MRAFVFGLKNFFSILKESFDLFKKNDPLRLAGATAFFANFAIPPILIILIRLFGMFTDRRTFVSNLFDRLSNILDESSINQVRQTLRNIRGIQQEWYVTLISFIFFMFVATTLFSVIKNSLDQIWNIGISPDKGFLFRLKLRAISFVIILIAGILFFIGLIADSIQAYIGNFISDAPHSIGLIFTSVLNQFLFICIVTGWFTIIFRFLTNGRPTWSAAFAGGLLTGCLFTGGKFILRFLLPLSNIENIYGTSGSIVLIMLFVFYSSMIFYFGGCFVKAYSVFKKKPIRPISGTYNYEMKALMTD